MCLNCHSSCTTLFILDTDLLIFETFFLSLSYLSGYNIVLFSSWGSGHRSIHELMNISEHVCDVNWCIFSILFFHICFVYSIFSPLILLYVVILEEDAFLFWCASLVVV